jgi:MFS family permease
MSVYFGSRTTNINVNQLKSIFAIVYLAVIGPCMFILQPGYIQGLVEYSGFTEESAGLIASAEMFGLAAMAICINFIMFMNWRLLCVIFLVISAIGNLVSANIQDANTLMIARFITGLGSGGLIAITFTMMGLTERSDRNMGFIIKFVLIYGALGLWVMPTAFQTFGVEGLLIFFGVFCASGLLFIPFLPCSHQLHESHSINAKSYSWSTKVIALAGILAYNLAIGIVWVYMFLVGIEANISEQTVANALTISQFLGILGALFAVIYEIRFGRILPLMIGIFGGAIGIAMLLNTPSVVMYTLGVCLFNLLWNLSMPYLLALLADYDAKGTIVTIGVALQMLGYAAGPAIAASLLGVGGYDFINTIAIGLFALSAFLLIPGLRLQSQASS